MKKYIILLIVLFITPFVISQQSNVGRGRIISSIRMPRGATLEDGFVIALKDPNIYIGVFERPPVNTKLSSGEHLYSLPDVGEATNRFSPLLCVKAIKGKFIEPIWYKRETIVGEGSPRVISNFFVSEPGSVWILAVQKTTKEERINAFGQDIEKYKYINDGTFYNILFYGYGAYCLQWPEGTPEREGIKKVPESMIKDLEEIVKVMPIIQKITKDPNDIETINKMSHSLKNDLAKSILEKVTTEKEQTPERQGTRVNRQ